MTIALAEQLTGADGDQRLRHIIGGTECRILVRDDEVGNALLLVFLQTRNADPQGGKGHNGPHKEDTNKCKNSQVF